MKRKNLCIALFAMLMLGPAFATMRIWDGGGADDNLSTAANWVGDVAPVSGDVLVFVGTTRRTPVNDYDPATTQFSALVFSNKTANTGFTLSGNKIRLRTYANASMNNGSGNAFAILLVPATGSLTETLDLEVELLTSGMMGGWNASNHHATFKQLVTGSGGSLMSMAQNKGTLRFEGGITNFAKAERPNGNGGVIDLPVNANGFIGTASHSICEGILRVAGVEAYGGATRGITMGQPSWDTPAELQIAASGDTAFTNAITVRGPLLSKCGGSVVNNTAGTTVTLAGTVTSTTEVNSYYGATSGSGTRLGLAGAGDGVFAGSLATPMTGLQKYGTGTWTLAPESSCAATSGVWVTAGTLVIDGNWTAMRNISVSSGAVLAGTGTVGAVSLASGAGMRFMVDAAGYQALSITGQVAFAGKVTLSATSQPALTPGVLYTVVTLPAGYTGAPTFVPGTGFPETATFTWDGNTLKMSISSSELVWKGNAADNVWDTTTANWQGNLLFADASGTTFDDSAEVAGTVRIPATVRPHTVTVAGTNDFTFAGAGFAGACSVKKSSGTSTLTLANTNSHTGTTLIESGALILSGVLDGSPLTVSGTSTVFTNTPAGRISGSGYVNLACAACALAGTNDFTGGLTLSAPYTDSAEKMTYCVRTPAALGAGDVTLAKGSLRFAGGSGSAGRGRTFTFGTTGGVLLYTDSGTTIAWLGDVALANRTLELRPDGVLSFGEFGCSTTVRSQSGMINVRQNGTIHWYARLDSNAPFEQTDYNSNRFYAPGNKWSSLVVKAGAVFCHTNNTLAYAPVTLGQTYEQYSFNPKLDLNGFDQTIAALKLNDSLAKSSQTVTSAKPATLTISNDTDFVTSNQQLQFTGALSLRKCGSGTWTLNATNKTTGSVLVEAGTLVAATAGVFPTGSDESRLVILPPAKVVLTNGVSATVGRLRGNRDFDYPAGVYGGTGCTAAGAKIRPDLFGPGTGSLRVLHGGGGLAVIIR